MADPFSIAAAAVGLFDVAARTSVTLRRVCKDIKNAPALLAALSNEVVDLGVILNTIIETRDQMGSTSATSSETFISAIDTQLEHGRTILNKMTALVDELTEKNPTLKRVQFAMKKNQAAKLKDSLREVRMKLHDILVAHNV